MFNILQTKDEESQKYIGFAIHAPEREEQYLKVINRYQKDERYLLKDAFNHLVECIDFYAKAKQPEDILGQIFHELELHDKYQGQFFTPQEIADFMGQSIVVKQDETIERKGFITALEPCSGSGVMITGFAKALSNIGYDYRTNCCITCVDIDIKCVWMTYIQLSLYGIPAVVIHGNSLTLEEWERWYTPVYILDNWIWREKCGLLKRFHPEDEALKRTDRYWRVYRALGELMSDLQKPTQEPEDENFVEEVIEFKHPKQLTLDIGIEEVKASGVKHIRKKKIKDTEPKENLNELQIDLFNL